MFHHGIRFFVSFVEVHRFAGYLLLFIGMLFEGETLLLGSGILIHLGAFDPLDTYFIAFAGALIGDFLWYYLGSFLRDRYPENRFINYVKRTILRFIPHFERKPFWSIVASKFIYGTNRSAIVFSGFLRINVWLFAKAELFVVTIWTMLTLMLGYALSYTAINITHNLKLFGLIVAALIIAVIAGERIITSFLRNRSEENAS
jgi:membrane protein DedA with SNARE-associated domain